MSALAPFDLARLARLTRLARLARLARLTPLTRTRLPQLTRLTRTRLLAIALSTTGILVLAVAGAPAGGPSARAASTPEGGTVERTIKDGRIVESSGLARSLRHPGVLWTHNDSGNAARIYAIGPGGRTTATLTLRAEPNVDWEAVASLRVPTGGPAGTGQAVIAVGDIGDNAARRSTIRIAVLPEPRRLRTRSVTPSRVLRLRYPDGPRDAEALLADPRDGRLYVVTKALFGSELYAVPERIWPGTQGGRESRVTTLSRVARTTAGLVTDGTFLPDGRMLLRSYGRIHVLDRPESARDGRIRTIAEATLPEQEQGESIALGGDGREALVGSEGRRQPILRVPVPGPEAAAATSGGGQPSDPGDPGATGPDGAGSGGAGSGGPGTGGAGAGGAGAGGAGPGDEAATDDPGTADGAGAGDRTGDGGTARGGTPGAVAPVLTGLGDLRTWSAVIGGLLAVLALGTVAVMARTRRGP